MTIRTSYISENKSNINQLLTSQNKLASIQAQISSQKKVNTPSDDAVATSKILTINSQLDKIANYKTNISTAQEQVSLMEDSLSEISDALSRAYELTVQASNGTYKASNLQAVKSEIDQITESVMNFANTQYNGQYIFSGNNTSTPAYTKSADGSIVYSGSNSSADSSTRSIEIMEGVYLSMNVNGGDIFGNYDVTTDPDNPTGTGIFNTLSTLSNLLSADPTDYDAIASQLKPLQEGIDTISNTTTQYASYSAKKLDMTSSYLSTLTLSLKTQKSSLEDLDLLEATANMSAETYAYQASVSATAQTMKLSLLDYL